MELHSFLEPAAIKAAASTASKKRLLQQIAEMASDLYGVQADATFAALQERENLGPTGMGGGVAVPHARLPKIDRVVGIFVSLAKPIDFDAVDRRPVDLVFGLLAPQEAGAEHLRALARVSRTLRNADICQKLRSTSDASAIYAILTDTAASQAA